MCIRDRFVGAALIIRVASSDRTPAATDRMAAYETETEMEYINMAVDNSMLDDYSLYVYPVSYTHLSISAFLQALQTGSTRK